eukprot:jgi/Orpsp1_1/1188186/evm.model.d7180000063075.1
MIETNKVTTLKILSLIMIILATPYVNIFGFLISGFTLYGLQKKNIKLINRSLIPNIFEALIFDFAFVGYFILIICNKYNVLLILLVFIQASIQTYITINLFKLVKNPF